MSFDVTIFTGYPRSGTTMLGTLARTYLDVAVVNEGSFELWLADRFPQDHLPANDDELSKTLNQLLNHVYFQILLGSRQAAARGATREAAHQRLLELTQPRTVQALAIAVLRYTSEVLQLPRLGHEDPLLMTDLPKVLRIFPTAKIVHILRDPRDVATSILKFPWGANNVVVAALGWAQQVRAARQIGQEIGPERYLEVRYRNLLQSPREEMEKLMRFVCGHVDIARREAYVEETKANPLRNNVETWREELTAAQIEKIESACGVEMFDFGYSRVNSAPPITSAQCLFWQAHHRVIQLRNVASGRLKWNGGAVFERGPEQKTTEKIRRLSQNSTPSRE